MLKNMIVEKSKRYRNTVYPLLSFAAASVTAYACSGLITAPLICAFSGALSPVCSAAFTLGASLTLMAAGNAAAFGSIFCALVLAAVGKIIMREDDSPKTAAFITFVSMAFSGVVFAFLVEKDPVSAALSIVTAAAGSAASFFIKSSLDTISDMKIHYADKKTLTSFSAVFVLLVSQLSGLTLSVIDPGIAAACTVILCASRFFGCIGGTVCGVLASAGVTAALPDMGIQTVFFGAAGLAAGFASSSSRITIAAVFSAANLIGQLAVGMNDTSFCIQADTVLGGAIFLLLPERFIAASGKYFSAAVTDKNSFAGKEMEFAARSLSDIRNNINDVIKLISQRTAPYSMADDVCEKVCSKCRSKLDCWEKNYERTNTLFHNAEMQKSNGSDNAFLGFECLHYSELAEEFEKAREQASFNKMLSIKIAEDQNLLFAQMKASEEMIMSLSERMNVNISGSITANLSRILTKYNIMHKDAIAYYTSENKLIVEIYSESSSLCEPKEISRILTKELGTALEYSKPFECSDETRLRFNQKSRYSVSCISKQMSAINGSPSGDRCGCFTDGLGSAYIFISDGMGSGGKASLDAEISSKLFKRLIRAGMNCESAVKMINSVMLTKSTDESFATLDIAKIDLETGELVLYKSGASATLIKYDDAVMMFALPSNPVGIIPDPVICRKECRFDKNSILVMMSDGVPEAAYPYIKEQLSISEPTENTAENICMYSHKITSATMPDDVTVAIVMLKENDI